MTYSTNLKQLRQAFSKMNFEARREGTLPYKPKKAFATLRKMGEPKTDSDKGLVGTLLTELRKEAAYLGHTSGYTKLILAIEELKIRYAETT